MNTCTSIPFRLRLAILLPAVLLSVLPATAQPAARSGKRAAGTRVVAHRGYWDTEGSAQNSIAALQKAQALNIYGSEFDVNRTLDGQLVIAHGPMEQGVELQKVNSEALSGLRLKNGEKLPTLEEYLACAKKDKKTRLVLELKPHDTPELEDIAIREIIAMLNKYGLTKQTDFISFSLHACWEFARLMPGNSVAYLDGKYSPAELKQLGINGLDYHYSEFEKHPEWVKQAHDLGMSVNVWTVNAQDQLQKMIDLGVDFLTTNDPVLAKRLVAESGK